MRISDIRMRDPFVLRAGDGDYRLYGTTDANLWGGPATGFDCYRSAGLEEWSGPFPAFRPPTGFWGDTQFWAPEVHRYRGRLVMPATFATSRPGGGPRGVGALIADTPAGPFEPWSDGPLTPGDVPCLDGTLFVDDDSVPWLVYSRGAEAAGVAAGIADGEMYARRLRDDLREPAGEPVLLMLWSSFGEEGYAMGVATSSGAVLGPWMQHDEPLWAVNGGHGMVFADDAGVSHLVFHAPNDSPHERVVMHRVSIGHDAMRLDELDRPST